MYKADDFKYVNWLYAHADEAVSEWRGLVTEGCMGLCEWKGQCECVCVDIDCAFVCD